MLLRRCWNCWVVLKEGNLAAFCNTNCSTNWSRVGAMFSAHGNPAYRSSFCWQTMQPQRSSLSGQLFRLNLHGHKIAELGLLALFDQFVHKERCNWLNSTVIFLLEVADDQADAIFPVLKILHPALQKLKNATMIHSWPLKLSSKGLLTSTTVHHDNDPLLLNGT